VRVGGMTYSCRPEERMGQRIDDMRIEGRLLDPAATYKVAGWASVASDVTGEPIWDVLRTYLATHSVVRPLKANVPRLIGVKGNPGLSD
jgi:sulfur-oxidizing protein SoxB